jgi:hypothetical protein
MLRKASKVAVKDMKSQKNKNALNKLISKPLARRVTDASSIHL